MRRLVIIALLSLAACGGTEVEPVNEPTPPPYETLSEYAFFEGDLADLAPVPGVVPYEVNSPLFADFALKERFLVLPEGETMDYYPDDPWSLPVGTMIVKTFGYAESLGAPDGPRRLLETRILLHEADGWSAHVYLWNDEQTEAVREVAGAVVPVTWRDGDGATRALDYRVPNTNQCARCHGEGAPVPLGIHTRQLDRDGQIEAMLASGLFSDTVPAAAERDRFARPGDTSASAEARARAYLDVNCAHCHNAAGPARSTGLFLTWDETDPRALGRCRIPFAGGPGTGGRSWDVVPGSPDESVMVFRMESVEPGVKMPELPSQLSDDDGVALVRAWIEGMEPAGCP